jgi:hypothetical protein
MKKIFSILFLISAFMSAQTDKPAVGISFSGFIKTDLMFDSRQTVSIREGHFLLYPQNENLDLKGNDINAKSNFNILSIQTRLNAKITGPDAFDAKTSGVVEGEFFGTADSDVNGFRLRHAYIKMDWEKLSLLVGQTWHPMFITEMFPGVVSFNTGVPFQPFSRNPQVKLTLTEDNFKFILVAASQRDFTSNGPDGFSSAYLRNSVLPNLHGQIQFNSQELFGGIGIDFKRLTPRIVTTKKNKTDAAVNSISFTAFTKLNFDPVTFKLQGVYGNNLADHVMLGGYAVKTLDTLSGYEEYTPLSCLSVWGEISTGKEIEFAVFSGYAKNLGAKDNIVGSYFGRGTNIENVFRVSPRIQFNSGKTRISTEVEYTSAGYGNAKDSNKGKVEKVKNITNVRVLAAFYFLF